MSTSAMSPESPADAARFVLTVIVAALVACSGASTSPAPQGPPPPPPPPATAVAAVTGVVIDDVANSGTAADLEVRFVSPTSLGTIREFRVVIVAPGSALPTAGAAASLPNGQFHAVAPTAGEQIVRLNPTTNDAGGDPVREGIAYRVAVVSVALSGADADHAISAPSASITLARTTLRITYLWNHGVMLEDDTMRIVVDAHQRRTDAFFIDPPPGAWADLEAGSGRFAGVRLALGSHNHEDHILPASVVAALGANSTLAFAGPGALTALLGGAPRVTRLDVPRGERRDVVIGGIEASAFHLRHFDAFNTDFSGVENYAWLVTVGGKRILHLGDSDLTPQNLAQFAAIPAMDIVIVPSWGALVSSSTVAAVMSTTRATTVVATHLRFALGDTDEQAVLALQPNAIVHRTPFAFHRF